MAVSLEEALADGLADVGALAEALANALPDGLAEGAARSAVERVGDGVGSGVGTSSRTGVGVAEGVGVGEGDGVGVGTGSGSDALGEIGATGVTGDETPDAAESPTALVATAVKEYAVPFERLRKVQLSGFGVMATSVEQVPPVPDAVTV
jgi:hypothetical protein